MCWESESLLGDCVTIEERLNVKTALLSFQIQIHYTSETLYCTNLKDSLRFLKLLCPTEERKVVFTLVAGPKKKMIHLVLFA